MRVGLLLAAVAVAAAFATAARASDARPATAQDRALLARPATGVERIAAQVAKRLTRRDPAVRCGPLGAEPAAVLGVTPELDGRSFDYFLMRPRECTYLAWFHSAPARWDPRRCVSTDCEYVGDIAMALEVVAHESYHLLGYANEARVECYGLQSLWFVARSLGASVAESQSLAQLYAFRMYPQRRTQTPEYWSAQCRDGGTLDLRPKVAAWPS